MADVPVEIAKLLFDSLARLLCSWLAAAGIGCYSLYALPCGRYATFARLLRAAFLTALTSLVE